MEKETTRLLVLAKYIAEAPLADPDCLAKLTEKEKEFLSENDYNLEAEEIVDEITEYLEKNL